MGIPSFYRWLVEHYPLAVSDVIEESLSFINGVQIPLDLSNPNPNGVEFDNLYLDMNGIIHPCFHPEDQPAPKSYDEVFKAVFKYIDRIFSIIRPRKLLYMAIDGVAPRAKMNQQRSRRFRAAKDATDEAARDERLRTVFESEGEKLSVLQSNSLDSNVITPGTEFMATLSSALQYYVHLRINGEPGWHGIKVILSDANVVGEGEHKIMSYIRLQRNLPGFDPNTRHCLYGLDADLIMLALATHEIHFSILREDVHMNGSKHKGKDLREKGFKHKLQGAQKLNLGEIGSEEVTDYISRQQFKFFNVWVLRDYLVYDMKIPNSTVEPDLERMMDDFVFMCLLVGNDFLPHVPSLEISEGAIDLLMTVYKKEFVQMGGYLTDSYQVNLKRVEHFIQAVGFHENAIFRRRSKEQNVRDKRQGFSKSKYGSSEARILRLAKRKQSVTFWSSVNLSPNSTQLSSPLSGVKDSLSSVNNATPDGANGTVDNSGAKETLSSVNIETPDGANETVDNFRAKESQSSVNISTPDGANETVDNIKLGEEGWKERFYTEKFEAKTEDERDKIRKHAVLKYIEGMCWVMHYYYEGVCSWQWFYPYHYAPFASDFYDLEHVEIRFTPGKPFKPFDQLMAVLPAASAHALPLCYRKLMTDSSSPILDFYPNDFKLDMNGKRFEWQAVCKLPFIEEARLLAEIAKVEHTLTEEEMHRNSLGMDTLFLHLSHPLAAEIIVFYERNKDHPKLANAKVKRRIDPKFSDGMNGFIYISDRPLWPLEICSSIGDMEKITMNKVISVFYRYPTSHPHIPRPPEGIAMPVMSVRKEDILPASVLWHDKSSIYGRLHSERPVPKSISGSCLAKLAHRLILEYYVEKSKEIVNLAVLNGSIAVEDPTCPTQPNSESIVEKKTSEASCVNVTELVERESDSAGTKSNRMTHKRAAHEKSQLNGKEPKKETDVYVTVSGKKKRKSKAADEKMIDSESCVKATKNEKKESDTELGRRKRKLRAAGEKKEENHDEHLAVDAPSFPTQPNSRETVYEKNMDAEIELTATKCENLAEGKASSKPGKRKRVK